MRNGRTTVFILCAVYLLQSRQAAADPSAVIASPPPNAAVDRPLTAAGHLTGLPLGHSAFLFVHPVGTAGWFPQEEIAVGQDGGFSAAAWLGGDLDQDHLVAVVEANPPAARYIAEKGIPSMKKGEGRPLPPGTRVLALTLVKLRQEPTMAWVNRHANLLSLTIALLSLLVAGAALRVSYREARQRKTGASPLDHPDPAVQVDGQVPGTI